MIDIPSSTITINGRRFPACTVICPQEEWLPERNELDRSLGTPSGGNWTYVPAENGILIEVTPCNDHDDCWFVWLNARTCRKSSNPFDWEVKTYLPHGLAIANGELTTYSSDHRLDRLDQFHWSHAASWWVVEHIDRVSRLPFVQPEGPEVKLVRLDYFTTDRRLGPPPQ